MSMEILKKKEDDKSKKEKKKLVFPFYRKRIKTIKLHLKYLIDLRMFQTVHGSDISSSRD